MISILSLHSVLRTVFFKMYAGVAQLVEHDLAKVGVAGSSLVSCSKKVRPKIVLFFCKNKSYLGDGIGRHAGLKIL